MKKRLKLKKKSGKIVRIMKFFREPGKLTKILRKIFKFEKWRENS